MSRGDHTFDLHSLPPEACQFRAAPATVAPQAEGQRGRRIEGVAYSGEPIQHLFWGATVIDLQGAEFADKVPLLVEHDAAQRAGVASLRVTERGLELSGRLMPHGVGADVAADADAGFPWQLSIHAQPLMVEEVKAGASATVNGREVQGPAVIFRRSLIREVSLTPVGADARTSAQILAAAARLRGGAVQREEPTMPDPKQTQQEDIAALFARIEELEGELKASREAQEQAERRAQEAEAKLAEHVRATRRRELDALFSALGQEATEERLEAYLSLPEAAYSTVVEDLRAAAERAKQGAAQVPGKDALFSARLTEGQGGDPDAEREAWVKAIAGE